MHSTVLTQIKRRRLQLGLKGTDMPLRVGLNRQQYGKIEKDGNPSLATLDKIAEGLDATLMLIPKELAREVEQLLEAGPARAPQHYAMNRTPASAPEVGIKETIEDPWQVLGDD